MTNLFERASRDAIRFATTKGLMSTEDLWNLPLKSPIGNPSLNNIAIALALLEKNSSLSFVDDAPPADELTQLKLDIVKHIIAVRKAQAAALSEAQATAARRQRLLALIDQKEDEKLSAKSLDELRAEVAAL